MQSDYVSTQLSIQQLKIRQQSEDILKLQQNTQFLTHLMRYSKHKHKIVLSQNIICDMRSLTLITVQLSYLLFTCTIKNSNIFISKQFLLLRPYKKQLYQQLYLEYILQKSFVKLSQQQQKYITKHFTKHEFNNNQHRSYGLSIIHHINKIILLMNMTMQKIMQKIRTNDKMTFRTMDKIIYQKYKKVEQVIKKYIQPNINTMEHARIVILALEQTEIYREFSTLVKVMNNSIFSTIRNNNNKLILSQICHIEQYLMSKYNKDKPQSQALQIQKTIQQFLGYLAKNQVIFVDQSMNKAQIGTQGHVQTTQNKSYNIGQIDTSSIDRKYTAKIYIFQKLFYDFSQSIFKKVTSQALNNYNTMINDVLQPNPNQPRYKNQFFIEYITMKGIISLKFITPIQLNIENNDVITYQTNNMSYFLSNLTIETTQKISNKSIKKRQKQLVIKTLSYLNANQHPLFKIMIMIDLVMLCGKISEPQFYKRVIYDQDYMKMQEMSMKIQHMIRLFIRKIQKFYKVIYQKNQNKGNKFW